MTITAALATALAALTEALDEPDADIAHSLNRLITDAQAAVPSYLGLTVVVSHVETPLVVTVLTDEARVGEIRTSLHVTLGAGNVNSDPASVEFILYGGDPGTFVDLAADMAWLTGQTLSAITLDEHLDPPVPVDVATQLSVGSEINQALGVLIGRGHTSHEADRKLQEIADANDTDRHGAAKLVLDGVVIDGDKGGEDR